MSDTEPEITVDPIQDLFSGDVTPTEGISPEELLKDFDLGPTEEIPSFQIGDSTCHVCGAPTFRPPGLTKTGRKKRAPKYCPVHDPTLAVANEPQFQGGELPGDLRRVQEELADEMRLIGIMAGQFLPVTGVYVLDQADPFTQALVKMAAKNPKVLRVLYRTSQVAPLYQTLKTVGGIAKAIQVDTQGASPHDTVGEWLGVGRAYDSVYFTSPPSNESPINNNGSGRPPRYAPAA